MAKIKNPHSDTYRYHVNLGATGSSPGQTRGINLGFAEERLVVYKIGIEKLLRLLEWLTYLFL